MKKGFLKNSKKLLVSYLACLMIVCGTVFYCTNTTTKNPGKVAVSFAQKISDSIVKIETPFGYGSGIIIGKEKQEEKFLYYVLTAFHLINGHVPEEEKSSSQEIPFLLTSSDDIEEIIGVNYGTFFSSSEDLDAMVITFLSTRDFAVTKISTDYELMKEVYSCTCQLGELPSITKGIVSRLTRHFIISNAQISPGSSGGGLFIKYGNEYYLIGVAVSIAIKGDFAVFHCSYYVSSKSFLKFLNENKIPIFVQ